MLTIHRANELLNEFVDALYDAGVDVSYFPKRAEDVLHKYAVLFSVEASKSAE